MADTTPVAFVDDPHAPEIFVSAVTGYFCLTPNVILTFESARVDHSASPGPINRVVVARLAMSIPAAQALALGLHDFLRTQGYDPTAAAKAGATPQ